MTLARTWKRIGLVGAAFASLAGSSAWAAVPAIYETGPASRIHALTQDGKYAAGRQNVSGTNTPIFYDVTTGQHAPTLIPTGGVGGIVASQANGIVVRTDPTHGQVLGLAGVGTGGTNPNATWWEAPLATPTVSVLGTGWQSGPINMAGQAAHNSARIEANSTPTNQRWAFTGDNSTNPAALARVNATGGADLSGGTGNAVGQGISTGGGLAAGRVVAGWDSGGGSRRAAYWTNVNNAAGFQLVPGGGGGIRSEAYGISSNAGAPAANSAISQGVISGLDYTDAATTSYQAFMWGAGEATRTLLGRLPGDTRSVAYGVNGSKLAVGMSHPGSVGTRPGTYQGELATIWDFSGVWDNTGTPQLLTDLLTAKGIDWSSWTRLVRAVSVSDDGMTLAGWGTWAEDGSERGFIVTIPEPATLAFLALGGLLVSRRRRR